MYENFLTCAMPDPIKPLPITVTFVIGELCEVELAIPRVICRHKVFTVNACMLTWVRCCVENGQQKKLNGSYTV